MPTFIVKLEQVVPAHLETYIKIEADNKTEAFYNAKVNKKGEKVHTIITPKDTGYLTSWATWEIKED